MLLGIASRESLLGDTVSWAGQAEIARPDLAAVARTHPARERTFRVVCRKTGVCMQCRGVRILCDHPPPAGSDR